MPLLHPLTSGMYMNNNLLSESFHTIVASPKSDHVPLPPNEIDHYSQHAAKDGTPTGLFLAPLRHQLGFSFPVPHYSLDTQPIQHPLPQVINLLNHHYIINIAYWDLDPMFYLYKDILGHKSMKFQSNIYHCDASRFNPDILSF